MSTIEYNPWKLTERMDFHKATRDLPLPRETIVQVQSYLSKKSGEEIRKIIHTLEEMMHDFLRKANVPFVKGHIIIPTGVTEHERKELIQKAIYTKSMKEFAEKYLTSLSLQRKI